MSSQVSQTFGLEERPESNASDIAALNVKKREYQKEYMEYWNSTSELNPHQEPVAAVIAPISPYAAPQPGKFRYYGKRRFPDFSSLGLASDERVGLTFVAQGTRRSSMFLTTLR
jgi:hypothetical protein